MNVPIGNIDAFADMDANWKPEKAIILVLHVSTSTIGLPDIDSGTIELTADAKTIADYLMEVDRKGVRCTDVPEAPSFEIPGIPCATCGKCS